MKISRLTAALIIFGILFVIIFLVDYLLVKRKYLKNKRKKKKGELTEIAYLTGKFKLNKSDLNLNSLLLVCSLINAFIISLVCVVILLIHINIILKFILGFILLLALIYAIYEILGRHLERKVKNGN